MNPYGYGSQQIPERVIGPVRHEAVLAYRAWSIHQFSENFWSLYSCSITGDNWIPGENRAKHSGDRLSSTTKIPIDHEVPLWECVCGYWAVERFDNVYEVLHRSGISGSAHVYGSVYLWGKIIRHEEGYRAAMAQVAGLLLPKDTKEDNIAILQQIAKRYHVPLVTDKKYLGG